MDGVLETIYTALNERLKQHAAREAAPHPGPLPVKDGERE